MNNKITYHKEGDYLIPDLIVNELNKKDYHIGKYGRLRLEFLKEHKKVFYTELMIKGLLSYHLAEIDKDATKAVRDLVFSLQEVYIVPQKGEVNNYGNNKTLEI